MFSSVKPYTHTPQGNWHAGEANCKANHGARCNLDADCTGGGTCHAPVDAGSTFSVSIAQSGGSLCNPLCNGVASFTATVTKTALAVQYIYHRQSSTKRYLKHIYGGRGFS